MLRKLQPSLARRVVYTDLYSALYTAKQQQQQLFTDKSPVSFKTFSSTTLRADGQLSDHAPTSTDPVPEYSFSIRRTEAPPALNTQLRQSLRAWSVHNKRAKAGESPNDIPYEGRITQLPDSIFVGRAIRQTDDDEGGFERDTDEEAIHSADPVQPGDLFYLNSKNGGSGDAIYLGTIGLQSLFLTSSGKWCTETISLKRRGVTYSHGYVVPNFLPLDEVESLRVHLPKQDVVRSAREGSPPTVVDVAGRLPDHIVRPALNRLNEYAKEVQRFKRDYKLQLDQMYSRVASSDQWLRVSLKDLPSLVLGIDHNSMTQVAWASLVNHASTCHPLFTPLVTARTLQFLVGPQSLADDMELARQWAREYQEAAAQSALGRDVSRLLAANPLSSFISKAQRIIKKSRSLRVVTEMHVLAPLDRSQWPASPEEVPTGETFTDNDKVIINYLWSTSMRQPRPRTPEPQSALIVRAVGAYPKTQLSHSTIRLLLHELGCVDPWVSVEETAVPLPGRRASGTVLDDLFSQAAEAVESMTDPASMVTTFPDSMAQLREDWTRTEAFCIDAKSVKSAEDAISVEPDSETKDAYWIHAHFSHPTAFIDFDHPIAKLARKRGGSFFNNEPLSRTSLMVHNEAARQFAVQEGGATLTVSTLLGTDGRVHNIKVAPTRQHKLVLLDPRAVEHVLGFGRDDSYSFLAVGKVPKPSELRDLAAGRIAKAENYRPQLELIHRLITARRERRSLELETPASYIRTSFKQSASVVLPEARRANREHESYHWKGDPGIILKGERHMSLEETAQESRANDIVAQTMRLASESIGKWLSDRHIPAVYLGSSTAPAFSVQRLKDSSWNDRTVLPVFNRVSAPLPLLPYNMKQYAMCSSPIREYLDMFNQFQVTAYLKAQARGLVQVGEPVADESLLPFSRSDVEDFLHEDAGAGDLLEQTPRIGRQYWTCSALYRAFHLGEARLPETLEVLVTRPYLRNADGTVRPASGQLIPWSANVNLEETPEAFEIQAKYRNFIPVKLISVDPHNKLILARAIGPPTNEQKFLDPIHSYTEENFLVE